MLDGETADTTAATANPPVDSTAAAAATATSAPVVEITPPATVAAPTAAPVLDHDWSAHPPMKEAIDFVMSRGYAAAAAELIVLEHGWGKILADQANPSAELPNAVATGSSTHADESGDVGETGEHGELGSNAQ